MLTDDQLRLQQAHLRTMRDDLFPLEWIDQVRREFSEPEPRMVDEETIKIVQSFESDRQLRDWIQTKATPAQVIGLFHILLHLTSILMIAEDEPERRDSWARLIERERTARNAFAVARDFSLNADGYGR